MIRNFLKLAIRSLLKYRFITFINLFGLTLGLTCCLLITTYLLNELSYDRFNPDAGRIYRVTRTFRSTNGSVALRLATISPPFGYYFPAEFPQIQSMTRLENAGTTAVRYQDKVLNQKDLYFADDHFFDFFPVRVLRGDARRSLAGPFSVMMTPEAARRYFGSEDPMNKIVRLGGLFNCQVTGIYEALPENAHLHPDMLLSFTTLEDSTVYGAANLRTNWGNNSFFTYLKLPPGYDPASLEKLFPAFLDRHMADEYKGYQPSKMTELGLQPLTDIHLHSHTDYEAEPNGDISRVYIFAAVAAFLLLIACINFMNLSTARSALRAREIGIRKVIGARRRELILQFLSESVLLTLLATWLAMGLTWLAIPWLNRVAGQHMVFASLLRPAVLVPLALAPFVIGVLAGIYPALFLSSFQPIKTLKGLFRVGGSSISFRQALVVTQFTIGIVLIVTTTVVFQQLRYTRQADLGYTKEHVITLPYNQEIQQKFEAFRTALLGNTAFVDLTRTSRVPTGRLLDASGASVPMGDTLQAVSSDVKYVTCDYDFLATYGVGLAAGRFFSRDYGTDTSNFVVNQAAVKAVGWKSDADAIGKEFRYDQIRGRIIGVMKDFHFESLHQRIVPLVMLLPPSAGPALAGKTQQINFNFMSVRLAGRDLPASLAFLERTWKGLFPETPFEYNFLDQQYDRLYLAEQRQASLFTAFSGMAILIACLGLLGLSAFAISQRVKEIGVRKVLGASTRGLVTLLSADFLRLVALSALIACPIAWYAMDRWLHGFAYRVHLQVWVFLAAGLLAAAIAFATISFQAVRAALANPVNNLRTE
ncbi:MAG TPA: ABC transporter permease [Chitinophagaceae bacterium]|nr:ABC transporter permease [Chitinophagaceae bacterium]